MPLLDRISSIFIEIMTSFSLASIPFKNPGLAQMCKTEEINYINLKPKLK